MISIGFRYPLCLFLIILYFVVLLFKEKLYFFKYHIPLNISKKDKDKKTNSMLFLLIFSLVLSISAPEIKIYRYEKKQKKVSSFVFDLTITMNSSFFDKSRIEISKEIAEHTIKINSESKFSLVSFAEKVEIKSPLTPDKKYLVKRIKKLKTSTTDTGSPLTDSIFFASKTLRWSKEEKMIIVFTDCENDKSSLKKDDFFKLLKKEKIPLFIVTFSEAGKKLIPVETPSGTVLIEKSLKTDEVFLRKTSNLSNGKYFKLKTKEDVKLVKKVLEDEIFSKTSKKKITKKIRLRKIFLMVFFITLIVFTIKKEREKNES